MNNTEKIIFNHMKKSINPNKLLKTDNLFLKYASRLINPKVMKEKLPVFIDLDSLMWQCDDIDLGCCIIANKFTVIKGQVNPYMYDFCRKLMIFACRSYNQDFSWYDKEVFKKNVQQFAIWCINDLIEDGLIKDANYNKDLIIKEYMKLFDRKWKDCYIIKFDGRAALCGKEYYL